MTELYQYQTQFIDWAIKHYDSSGSNFILLADEQGLGKTVQSLMIANHYLCDAGKVLIICPASLRLNWEREIDKWLHLPSSVAKMAKHVFSEDDIFHIVNYDLCNKPFIKSQLLAQDYELIIIDEAHYLKNIQSLRCQAILGKISKRAMQLGIVTRAKKVLALTGTPIPNRPIELFPLLNGCAPSLIKFMGFYEFSKRYCDGRTAPWGFDSSGASNLQELRELIQPVMIRRTKEEVLKELPPKTYRLIALESDSGTKKAIAQEKEFNLTNLYNTGKLVSIEGISTVRRMMGQAKIKVCLDYIQDQLASTHKIIVFAHHKEVINSLYLGLKEFNPVSVTGETNLTTRQENVDLFQQDNSCRVFLGNIQAAGVGLTLTAASQVVFVEPSWVPADIEQAADRCHRIGQTNNVTIDLLVIEGSIDEYILTKVLKKKSIIDEVVVKNEIKEDKGEYRPTGLEWFDHQSNLILTRDWIIKDIKNIIEDFKGLQIKRGNNMSEDFNTIKNKIDNLIVELEALKIYLEPKMPLKISLDILKEKIMEYINRTGSTEKLSKGIFVEYGIGKLSDLNPDLYENFYNDLLKEF